MLRNLALRKMLVKLNFISKTVKESLEKSDSINVHSVFDNGINVQAKDRLIFLGKEDGPSAINVGSLYLPVVTQSLQGQSLIYHDSILEVPEKGISLDFNHAQILEFELTQGKIMSYTSDKLLRLILGYEFVTGFDMTTQVLLDTLVYKFSYDQESYLDYLIGRGKGLTPSGDDFIIGMLAYHQVRPFLEDAFIHKLKEMLLKKPTTDISMNYFKDSLEGNFSKDILDLFSAMERGDNLVARIYNIAGFGHSSGKDTLSGIAMAIIMEQKIRRLE